MRHGRVITQYVDVDVDIEEFDDETILMRACEILGSDDERRFEKLGKYIVQLRRLIEVDVLPPISTAAKMVIHP